MCRLSTGLSGGDTSHSSDRLKFFDTFSELDISSYTGIKFGDQCEQLIWSKKKSFKCVFKVSSVNVWHVGSAGRCIYIVQLPHDPRFPSLASFHNIPQELSAYCEFKVQLLPDAKTWQVNVMVYMKIYFAKLFMAKKTLPTLLLSSFSTIFVPKPTVGWQCWV